MVREIKKLGTKFQACPLGGVEELEYREIPALISRCLNGVTADVAERTVGRIGERASVEPCGRRVNPVGSKTALRYQDLALWIGQLTSARMTLKRR